MRDTLALASRDRSWSLLLRHAERPAIPAGTFGNDLSITTDGEAAAEGVGLQLRGRLRRVVTSPVRRCVQTAEAILRGAAISTSATTSTVLGEPGVWISDGDAVGDAFLQLGPQGVVARQLVGDVRGIIPLKTGVARFVEILVAKPGDPGQNDVFVSHNAVVAPLLGALLDIRELPAIWPGYLEGAFLSRSQDGLDIIWRGSTRSVTWRPA
jgi:broad specificity phosphatase PhoE